MTAISRRIAAVVLAVICFGALPVSSAAAQPPKQAEQYIPIDQLPAQEQIPAPRLLITAYSFVIVALFLYLLSVARRLSAVQREVERLEADIKHTGRT